MLIPAEEESVTVAELRPGDKIIDDDDQFIVRGEPVHRDGEVVVPLSVERDGDATPYGFTPGHRVTRVLAEQAMSERMPGAAT